MAIPEIRTYVLAGNCTFTLLSTKVKKRYTYKITRDKKDENRYFVRVMWGSKNDDEKYYRFVGWFYKDKMQLVTNWRDSMYAKMIGQFLRIIETKDELPETCKMYKSRRCARCGRLLTTPGSVQSGYGVTCERLVKTGGI